MKLIAQIIRHYATKRAPDLIIGPREDPYIRRWWIFRNRRFCSLYLHQILHSDDSRALHDHPWANVSFVFGGRYIEFSPDGKGRERRAGSLTSRKATAAHRLEILPGEHAWTLFLTGPVVRQWGFLCDQGWRPWTPTASRDGSGRHGHVCD